MNIMNIITAWLPPVIASMFIGYHAYKFVDRFIVDHFIEHAEYDEDEYDTEWEPLPNGINISEFSNDDEFYWDGHTFFVKRA